MWIDVCSSDEQNSFVGVGGDGDEYAFPCSSLNSYWRWWRLAGFITFA